ncbi:MAG TPA: polysaccharide biosynthesis/export family protein, partial [Thermoguttaceae bacterium]|nr:polysaccharide biosynthesis/export family protein [Thermoguttaceae bacterium]
MKYPRSRLLSRGSTPALLAALVVMSLAPGCASRTYRSSQLPAEFTATPAADLDTLNLSGLAGSTVAQDVIAWGDLLSVEIDAGLPEIEPRVSSVQVAKDGTARIPLVGPVQVAGMDVEQAEAAIIAASQSRGVYLNPFVSVRMETPRKNYVTVVGAVEKQGRYGLPRGSSSLMSALVRADGLSDQAGGEVEIRHTDPRLTSPMFLGADASANQTDGARPVAHEIPGPSADGVVRLNLLDAAEKNTAGKQELQDGDVVNVVARETPPVHVLGLVTKPGKVKTAANRDLYLLDAVAQAGGVANPVADRV